MRIFLVKDNDGYMEESLKMYEIDDLIRAVSDSSDWTEPLKEFEGCTGEDILWTLSCHYKMDSLVPDEIFRELKKKAHEKQEKQKLLDRMLEPYDELDDLVAEACSALSACMREDLDEMAESLEDANYLLEQALPILKNLLERIRG